LSWLEALVGNRGPSFKSNAACQAIPELVVDRDVAPENDEFAINWGKTEQKASRNASKGLKIPFARDKDSQLDFSAVLSRGPGKSAF
jgi:hypothetical protein